jgi:hypothetical protein
VCVSGGCECDSQHHSSSEAASRWRTGALAAQLAGADVVGVEVGGGERGGGRTSGRGPTATTVEALGGEASWGYLVIDDGNSAQLVPAATTENAADVESLAQLGALGVAATTYDEWPGLLEPIPVAFHDAAPPGMKVSALLEKVRPDRSHLAGWCVTIHHTAWVGSSSECGLVLGCAAERILRAVQNALLLMCSGVSNQLL